MKLNVTWGRRVAGAALTLLALAGCQTDDLDKVAGPEPQASKLSLLVSSADARPGDRIGVSLFVDGAAFSDKVVALKGMLSFDANKLEYLGQEMSDVFAIANEQQAEQGTLVFANLELKGLTGRTATFAFKVRDVDYVRGLGFQADEIVSADLKPLSTRGRTQTLVSAELPVPTEVSHIALEDWQRHFDPNIAIQKIAGENVANLRYGDANLDGAIDLFQDAFLVAGVSVGNFGLIAGSSSAPNRDVIVAGNPVPFNVGGPGVPGEGTAVGGYAAGVFVIEIFDAAAIATDAVNCAAFPVGQCPAGQAGNQPRVGDLVRQAIPAGGLPRVNVPAGNIASSVTWTKGNVYELQGIVRVTGGATLTIEPGTRIEGIRTAPSALFIERDGMIIADGTRTEPITFTCTGPDATKFPGCWSGLLIAGNAEINESNGTTAPTSSRNPGPTGSCQNFQNQAEGGGPLFGGCNNTDNSGIVRFAVIEYGGLDLTGQGDELNCFTLVGVGSGTTIDYVEARNGLDDGIEMFGGTVNMRHLFIVGNQDDSFDTSFGFSGSVQFMIVQHNPANADKGFEFDNANSSSLNDGLPRSRSVIYNATLIGEPNPTDPANESPTNNDSEDALHIRKGSHPFISNSIVSGWGRGFRMDDGQTCSFGQVAGDNSVFTIQNSVFHNIDFLANANAVPTPVAGATGNNCVDEATFIQTNMPGNTVVTGGTMFVGDRFNGLVPDFRVASGSPAASGGAAPPAGNTFIQSTSYRGAIDPGLGATQAPWYLGWTKGYAQVTP